MQIFVTNRAFNMFKIELENRDFRRSLYLYIVDAKKWAACAWQRPDIHTYIFILYFKIKQDSMKQ